MNPTLPHPSRFLCHLLCAALLGLPGISSAQEASDASPKNSAAQPAKQEAKSEATPEADPKLPRIALTPVILYQLLLAEIAGNRGNIPLATGLYSDLAKSTRDPRIAKRSTEVSIFARQTAVALESARIWVQTDPESPQARHALAGLLLNANQPDEAMEHLAKLLTIKPPQAEAAEGESARKGSAAAAAPAASAYLGERLDQLYRMLSRYSDKAAALRLIEQLTVPYENLPEAHLVRAQAAADAKDEPRALASLERALALRPDWAVAILFKAHLQQHVSSTLAEETLRGFLADHPKANEVRLAYARSLISDKHYEAARREFATLLEGNADNGEILYAVALLSLQLNDLAVAEKHLKRLLELGYGNPNQLRYYLGQVAEDTKRTPEALQWYDSVTPGEHFLPALSRAAALLTKEGRIEDGRALLQKAAEANPGESIPLLIAESQLLVNAGRHKDAYDLLEKHLASQPEQPDLLYESALLAEKLERLDVMERNLRKLIRIKPDDAHAYNALGYSLADHGLRLDEAQQLIETGLSLAPEDAFILDSKGWLLYRRGDNKGALEALQKAFGLRQDPEIAAHLGEVLWVAGRHEEALKTWNESAKANPTNQVLADTIKKFQPEAKTPAQ